MSDVMQYFKTVLLKALNIKIHVLSYHIGKFFFPIFNVFLNIRFTNNPAVEYFFYSLSTYRYTYLKLQVDENFLILMGLAHFFMLLHMLDHMHGGMPPIPPGPCVPLVETISPSLKSFLCTPPSLKAEKLPCCETKLVALCEFMVQRAKILQAKLGMCLICSMVLFAGEGRD